MPDENVVHKKLPRFGKFNFPQYTFKPDKVEDLGIHFIEGELINKFFSLKFSLRLNVTNSPPEINGLKRIPDQRVSINSVITYYIPDPFDKEGH